MSFSDALLAIMATEPRHGYDLKRLYDERFAGSRPLAYGQVYAALARLQRDGLVQIVEVAQEAGPERTVYAITAAGRTALRDWLDKTESPGPYPADELVRKTLSALYLGADAAGFLDRQRTAHLTLMHDLLQLQAETTETGARIALDHVIHHLDADLRWLETAGRRLTEPERPRS